jgi:hypothetical protein
MSAAQLGGAGAPAPAHATAEKRGRRGSGVKGGPRPVAPRSATATLEAGGAAPVAWRGATEKTAQKPPPLDLPSALSPSYSQTRRRPLLQPNLESAARSHTMAASGSSDRCNTDRRVLVLHGLQDGV